MPDAINDLKQATADVEDAARNIYYALSFLGPNHRARSNLELALTLLGIKEPEDVGLSDSVLRTHMVEVGPYKHLEAMMDANNLDG